MVNNFVDNRLIIILLQALVYVCFRSKPARGYVNISHCVLYISVVAPRRWYSITATTHTEVESQIGPHLSLCEHKFEINVWLIILVVLNLHVGYTQLQVYQHIHTYRVKKCHFVLEHLQALAR